MFDKLDFITEKYDELAQKVSDPEIINNQPVWQKHIKEMGEMEPIVKAYKEYKKAKTELADAKEILEEGDEEMRELAKMEISELEETIENQEAELKILLLPKDPNDEKNVILEVRAGTGGEEAALFGADLLRMYTRYAERNRWKTELMDINDTGIGGIKEASVLIKGKGAYKDSLKKTFKINPKKLSGLKVKAGKKQMTVSFKKDKSAGGYEIVYATSKNFKKGKKTIKIKSYKTAKKVISKLKSKKTYYVKVRSFKKVSGKTYYGAYTSVKSVKIK